MNHDLRLNPIRLAVCLAFSTVPLHLLADEPYPPTPPYLSASVTPNIMLYIDTSGSMLQNENNQWMQTGLCNSNVTAWNSCVDNNTGGYRTAVDNQTTTPNSKMNIAKRVSKNLINNNRNLRFGMFTFRDNPNNIGGSERGQAGRLRRAIGDVSTTANRDALFAAIDGIYGRTATPLAEGLLEVTRYYAGQSSLYGVNAGNYTSPIQYRCQKNFTIVITDGDATDDQNLPGTGRSGGDGNAAIGALAYISRDSSGAAVNNSFAVCRNSTATADSTYNVTCPATYESDGSTRDFGADGNRPSALRDVAMYANRADLRVGGTDLDGRSFDDPKYARQNMITYTVGFAVNNAVLPSAAKVGGGKYYNAANEAQLTDSLNDAIATIGNVVSNAGGGAASGTTLASADKMFQPLFHATGWYGELKCFQLDANGGISGGCVPNAAAVIPTASDRKIFSAKVVGGVTTPFAFNDSAGYAAMTVAQQTNLGTTAAAQKDVINFVRGQSVAGLRSRPNGLLGDIVDAQPMVVGRPTGLTSDTDYAAFQLANTDRSMVFVGANDGMLHGFSSSNMTEFFGYVPSPVYPRLNRLTHVAYGDSVVAPHNYFVNGALRQQDAKLGGAWKTVLVGGLAQGGQGYFALNATNQSTMSSASSVMWEFTDQHDPELGYTFGAPIIYNVRTSATDAVPAVLIANGYESDVADGNAAPKKSALFILKAEDGSVLKKISAPSGSGLSAPAGFDYPADGVLDYVYAGDDSGKVWRFDLRSNDIGVAGATAPEPKLIFDAGPGQPVVMRPAVMAVKRASDGVLLGNLVIFGTGRLFKDSDRSDTTGQAMYAVLDKLAATDTTVAVGSLVERTITEATSVTGRDSALFLNGNFRKISTAPALDLTSDTNTRLGWYLNLPVASERLVTSPVLLTDRLLFGTGVPVSAEKCSPGKGWLMGLNPLTGSVTVGSRNREFSFVDVKLDGRSDASDKIGFLSGEAFMSGYELDGIPTELTVISREINTSSISSDGPLANAGAFIALSEANAMGVFGGPVGKEPFIKVGIKGSTELKEFKPAKLGGGFKIETSIWREIK